MSDRRKFSSWLDHEIHLRGWSQAEFSRLSGLHRSIVSKVILGASTPTPETLTAIAKALGMPPRAVFEAAGELPPEPVQDDPLVEEGIHILRQLEGPEREDAIRFLRLRREVQEERQRGNVRKNKTRPSTS